MTAKDELFDAEATMGLFCDMQGGCGKGEDWALAMAYVPWQEWGELYDEELALMKGTLFPDLDKPFLGRKQVRHG